jgi:uncharacterized membrane protein HdeD (DUF308 family)
MGFTGSRTSADELSSDRMSAALAENWWAVAIRGVLAILFGAIAFIFPAAFRLNLQHGRWWLVLGGIANLAFGVLLVLAPLAGALVLTWWLGAYVLLFGGFLLALAFQLRSRRHCDPGHPQVPAVT